MSDDRSPEPPAGAEQPPDDAWASPSVGQEPAPDAAPDPAPGMTAAPEPGGGTDQALALPPPPGEPPADPNTVAITRAGLSQESADWLHQVAAQVDPRLDRVLPEWRASPQSGAARACAFGLLLGHLARTYPHARLDLIRTAEAHPSYSTLQAGSRLSTLEQIAADPQRMASWLGPLVGVNDPGRVQRLLD